VYQLTKKASASSPDSIPGHRPGPRWRSGHTGMYVALGLNDP